MTTSTTPTEQQALGQQAHAEELDPVFLLVDTDPDAMNAMNQQLIAGFRATGGQLHGAFQGVPLLLLTTTGVRSGRPGPRRSTTRPPTAAGSSSRPNPARHATPTGTTTCSPTPPRRSKCPARPSPSTPRSRTVPNDGSCSTSTPPNCQTSPPTNDGELDR